MTDFDDERHAPEKFRDLATHFDVPEPADVTAGVLARIAAEQPGRRSARIWRTSGTTLPRLATALVALLLAFGVAAAVSPSVRAAVGSVLRFAGIEVHHGSGPVPNPTGTPLLPGERTVDLATAKSSADFPVRVPRVLGSPTKVTVSDGTPPRVVSLYYPTARVDEFDGTISPVFQKFVIVDKLETVDVNGHAGYWIAAPHEVVYQDRDGVEHTETARMSTHTLIWQVGDVTLRLEANVSKDAAIAIAASFD